MNKIKIPLMEDWRYLMVNTRDVFRTKSKIYDETFFAKIVNNY